MFNLRVKTQALTKVKLRQFNLTLAQIVSYFRNFHLVSLDVNNSEFKTKSSARTVLFSAGQMIQKTHLVMKVEFYEFNLLSRKEKLSARARDSRPRSQKKLLMLVTDAHLVARKVAQNKNSYYIRNIRLNLDSKFV